MKIIIEVHDTPKTVCDTRQHFEDNFKADNYDAEIKVFHVDTSDEDKIVVITPNGDRRTFEALRLDEVDTLIRTLTQ